MLTVNRFDQSHVMEPCVSFRKPKFVPSNVYYPDVGIWSNDWRIGFRMDNLLFDLSLDMRLPAMNFFRHVGIDYGGAAVETFKGYSPYETRQYDAFHDLQRYGSVIGGALKLRKPRRAITWGSDTDMTHASYRGHLDCVSASNDLCPTRIWFSSNSVSYHGLPDTQIRQHGVITAAGPNGYRIVTKAPYYEPWSYTRVRVFLDEIVNDFIHKTRNTPMDVVLSSGYARNTLTYSNFRYVERVLYILESGECEIEILVTYNFLNRAWSLRPAIDGRGPWGTFHYEVTHKIRVHVVPDYRAIAPSVGTHYNHTQNYGSWNTEYTLLEYENTHLIPNQYGWEYFTSEMDHDFERSVVHIVREPSDGHVIKNHIDMLTRDDIPRNSVNALLDSFVSLTDDVHGDIIPFAALSANDALESFSHSDINLIEGVPELPGILSGIKNITSFLGHLKALTDGDLTASSKIVDDLAEGYLAYKYQYSPLLSDIDEAHRIAEDVYQKLGEKSNELPDVLYGSFVFDFPGSIKLRGVSGQFSVVVRSKMSLKKHQSVILAWILALDSVGLLPSATRLWDCVKFSFVIDWFTSLGDRLHDADTTAVRFTVQVEHYVNSYEYRFLPDSRFLSRYGCRSDFFQLRVYKRYRSQYHPFLHGDRFDPHPPGGFNRKLLAAGSLLWVSK